MNELSRMGANLPQTRGLQRQAALIVEQTRLRGLQIDAEAALEAKENDRMKDNYNRAMFGVAELDNTRRMLARNNPELNEALGMLELGFINNVNGRLNRMGGS